MYPAERLLPQKQSPALLTGDSAAFSPGAVGGPDPIWGRSRPRPSPGAAPAPPAARGGGGARGRVGSARRGRHRGGAGRWQRAGSGPAAAGWPRGGRSMAGMEPWKQCGQWLISCKVLPPNHRVTWDTAQVFDLAQTLRDGVLLCQLLNNLRGHSINLKEINLRPQMSQVRPGRVFLGVGGASPPSVPPPIPAGWPRAVRAGGAEGGGDGARGCGTAGAASGPPRHRRSGAGGPWLWAHGELPGSLGEAAAVLGLGVRTGIPAPRGAAGLVAEQGDGCAGGEFGEFSRAVRCSSPGREPALAEQCQSLGLCLRCGEAAAEVTLLHLGLQSYSLCTNCWRWLPALFLMDKRWPHGITQRYLDS